MALEDEGRIVARARLRAANGITLEDSVEDGLALFLTDDAVTPPIEAELLDVGGAVVSQRVWVR